QFVFLDTAGQHYTGLYASWPFKTMGAANYFAGLQAPSRLTSAAGTLGNQNVLGGYLAATIPVFLILPVAVLINWQMLSDALLVRFKGMREGTANLAIASTFVVLLTTGIASLACLLATDTRGAWVGILAAVVVGALAVPAFFREQLSRLSRQAWTRIGIGTVVGLVMMGTMAYAAGVTPKMLITKIEGMNTVDQRIVAWEVAGKMAEANPVLGLGLGTYKIYYFRYLAKLFGAKPIPTFMHNRYVQAHNDFVQLAGEEGLPGMLFAVAILLAFWFSIPRYIWRNRAPPTEGLLLMGSMLGTIALCGFALTGFPFHIAASATVWVTIAAFTGAALWQERRAEMATPAGSELSRPKLPLEARWGLSGAIILLAGSVVVLTYLPYKADMLTKDGMELYKRGQIGEADTVLKQAIRMDPERGDARLVLGIIDAMMNHLPSAERQLIRAQTSYDDVTLHYYLGRVYEVEKRWADAK
ncbi:MAG: O-antigen ligase family protein, partial [Cyanobacteria bacterium REEB65]|nr:O-antigen ligase family protein [Cyanobacteria bacterium REEB65]